MIPPDVELIRKIKDGDEEACAQLYKRYADRILNHIYRYVRDYHKAEDLTIETFMNLLKSIHEYEEMGVFSAWLYKIAGNCAKRELENRARRKEVSLDADIGKDSGIEADRPTSFSEFVKDERSAPDTAAQENEIRELIYTAVWRLKPKYRDVVLLCEVDQVSYKEAAKILNINKITVGTRLIQARQMLYNMLAKFKKDLQP